MAYSINPGIIRIRKLNLSPYFIKSGKTKIEGE